MNNMSKPGMLELYVNAQHGVLEDPQTHRHSTRFVSAVTPAYRSTRFAGRTSADFKALATSLGSKLDDDA